MSLGAEYRWLVFFEGTLLGMLMADWEPKFQWTAAISGGPGKNEKTETSAEGTLWRASKIGSPKRRPVGWKACLSLNMRCWWIDFDPYPLTSVSPQFGDA